MTSKSKIGAFVAQFLQLFALGAAMKASPHPFTVSQPDGTPVTLFVRGNEFFNYYADINGFPVVKLVPSMQSSDLNNFEDIAANAFVFAESDRKGSLLPTAHQVGSADPSTIPSLSPLVTMPEDDMMVDASQEVMDAPAFAGGITNLGLYSRRRENQRSRQGERSSRAVTTGTVNNLVLMMRWADAAYDVKSDANGFVGLPTVQVQSHDACSPLPYP
jgi:hypothetical protein